MKVEAVVLDIGNEQIYSYIGTDPMATVKGAIQDSCGDVYAVMGMTDEDFLDGYRFARTTDERMSNLLPIDEVVVEFDKGNEDLFVIVSLDRLLAPIGFFRRL